jgi:FixJ family two-component response regulator
MSQPAAIIAVVDDDASVGSALARLMTSAGLEAQTCSCGGDFLESLQTRRPNCLLLDLHMTGMGGFEVQAQLQSARARIPVMIITGHDSAETREWTSAAGSVAYLSKPVEEKKLFEAIDLALSSAQQEE